MIRLQREWEVVYDKTRVLFSYKMISVKYLQTHGFVPVSSCGTGS